MGIPFTQLDLQVVAWSEFSLRSGEPCGRKLQDRRHSLLGKAEKPFAPTSGSAAIETERKLP